MSKIDCGVVEEIVKSKVKDNKDLIEVLNALKKAIEDDAAEKAENKAKTEKKKFMAVQLNDLESVYILQGKESFDESTLVELIKTKISVDFNQSPKGSKNPVANLADLFEFVSNKFFKDYDLSVKTKIPLDLIHSQNSLK
jgi:oligoribonuclease (3'-5' exoribonuclease)